uniref:Uncharacterized protein n=1 Tax=Anguilla anguilla TaxID=7936 RepID=A0A0E9X3R2_ANGAN
MLIYGMRTLPLVKLTEQVADYMAQEIDCSFLKSFPTRRRPCCRSCCVYFLHVYYTAVCLSYTLKLCYFILVVAAIMSFLLAW